MRERELAEARYWGRHEDIKIATALESRKPTAEAGSSYSMEDEEPSLCLSEIQSLSVFKKPSAL